MKIKHLSPSLILVSVCATLFISCKKDESHPHPPTDSTNIVDLKKGLLLYLPFSGNFADSSGNNNPTTGVNGAVLTSDQHGSAGSALNGTGNGERVIVTNNGSIKFDTAYTLSLNVLLNTYQRSSWFDMVNHATGAGWVFGVGTAVGNTNLVNMNTVDTTGDCSTTVQPYNGQLFPSTAALAPGSWYNVVIAWYKGLSKIYINGHLDATFVTPNGHVPECMTSSLTVGGWWDGDPTSINGKLDEIRLYNRALNANEITQLSKEFTNQPSEPVADLTRGLLLYLPFNGNIADSSGHNNPTKLVGGAALSYDEHGYANSAFEGNGAGGRLIVTNNGSINFDTAFSLSMSFMERDNSTRQMLMSMVDVATAKGPTFGMGNSLPGTRELDFGVVSNLISCDDFGVPANTTNDTSHNFIPQPESWYNVVCTYHKGTVETYVNGVLNGRQTGPYTAARICPGAEVVVGGWWDNDPASINGKIDNVRIYNRVLMPAEITLLAQHYQPNSNRARR